MSLKLRSILVNAPVRGAVIVLTGMLLVGAFALYPAAFPTTIEYVIGIVLVPYLLFIPYMVLFEILDKYNPPWWR